MKKYDYLIVGCGLYGATFAHQMKNNGKRCLIIDKREHIGGNVYCEQQHGVTVHKYGAHIFHTNDKEIWDFVCAHVDMEPYINSPLVRYKDEQYNLPFNMNTFHGLWGVKNPEEAMAMIEKQRAEYNDATPPSNLEEQALSLVGRDIYEKLIKGYTEKQWGKKATKLPAFIIQRIPVRFTYDNNYFSDKYQGIPFGGYNTLIKSLIDDVDVKLGVDFFDNQEEYRELAKKIVFTGAIDEYFSYCFGALEYRSLRFEHEVFECENVQGNAVINYSEASIPYTRIIEHRHFSRSCSSAFSVLTKEYPDSWALGKERYYPVNNDENMERYSKYRRLAKKEPDVIFGGRLAEYKYYDMHQVISSALYRARQEFE